VVFIPLQELPKLYQTYASMNADLEVNERVYLLLLEQYEDSGIESARNTPSVQIVDHPNLPEKRAGIPRWVVVIIAGAGGAVWCALLLGWWGWISLKKRTDDEEAAFKSVIDTCSHDLSSIRRRLRL
jgi:uncharacterized protein involved in exopolysaccharide biosynthesis